MSSPLAPARALRGWFRSLEAWQKAATLGSAIGITWALAFLTSRTMFAGQSLTLEETVLALGGAAAIHLVALWVWGIWFMYNPWLEQPDDRHLGGHEYAVKAALAQLILGGLEAALMKIGPSISFLARLPLTATRALRPRSGA